MAVYVRTAWKTCRQMEVEGKGIENDNCDEVKAEGKWQKLLLRSGHDGVWWEKDEE